MVAEREGFEPSVRDDRTHTFQACSFDHSDTSPRIEQGSLNQELMQRFTLPTQNQWLGTLDDPQK